jgi:hypothetical protein
VEDTLLYIEEKVSVKPVCGDCCLRTNETINELQLNAELTIQESYELKRRLSNIEREKMNIDDKLKVFLNDWTSWRMKTKNSSIKITILRKKLTICQKKNQVGYAYNRAKTIVDTTV